MQYLLCFSFSTYRSVGNTLVWGPILMLLSQNVSKRNNLTCNCMPQWKEKNHKLMRRQMSFFYFKRCFMCEMLRGQTRPSSACLRRKAELLYVCYLKFDRLKAAAVLLILLIIIYCCYSVSQEEFWPLNLNICISAMDYLAFFLHYIISECI